MSRAVIRFLQCLRELYPLGFGLRRQRRDPYNGSDQTDKEAPEGECEDAEQKEESDGVDPLEEH